MDKNFQKKITFVYSSGYFCKILNHSKKELSEDSISNNLQVFKLKLDLLKVKTLKIISSHKIKSAHFKNVSIPLSQEIT